MRPIRIRARGFSAYRSEVEMDLEDVEFFSLSGATGSGKSSLVDAMVFALYGRVPRLGGNAVAPAITAGSDTARVAFDFEVGGVTHTAVRMAQRTPSGGATVKEARLQRGDTVVADGADDVTRAVEDLLRLRFDDFTRTVVLPQGEFARFLKATRSERQGLLRSLLGLDIYGTVRGLAKTRQSVASDRAQSARRRLETLELPSDDDAERARARLDLLAELAETIGKREQEVATMRRQRENAVAEVERLEDAVERLTQIRPPDRFEELDQIAAVAREAVADAEEQLELARSDHAELEAKHARLPTTETIAIHRRHHGELSEIRETLATEDLEHAQARVAAAGSHLEAELARLSEIRDRLAGTRVAHAAHALASSLVVGEPCPVCDRTVESLPEREKPAELSQLEGEEQAVSEAVAQARESLEEARTAATQIETAQHALGERLTRLEEELESAPSLQELDEIESALTALGEELETSGRAVLETEAALKKANSELEETTDSVRRVARELTAAQLSVADLKPPVSESDDVMVQWKELLHWREEALDRAKGALSEAAAEVKTAQEAEEVAVAAIVSSLEKAGVSPVEPYAAQVAGEHQSAKQVVALQEKTVADARELGNEIEEAEERAAVAAALAGHLRADGFEQWLMVGALGDLVAGANGLLSQLSDGGYSLHSDEEGSFSIIDHRNADEVRSVATLSGGETFLVSLALALSLAETLASAGGAGLDAIILDEGFGTLDSESLDTVASVLEELAGEGLMVGVITHVKELAARAPVRFEVTREPSGSEVVMVS